MKALRSHAVGGPESLTLDEIEAPTPGPGQVLVAIKACAINFPDTLMIRDLYQFKPQRPYAPGGEISGTIEALGEGVSGWAVGDKVLAGIGNGGLAEKVAVDSGRLFRVPDGVSFETAASILMTYGTTIHGLKDRGRLKAGDTLLVLGAAGGVGLSGVELGKAYGARVVAAVSSEDKAVVAREAGADEVVIYGRPPFDKDQSKALAEQFKAACGPNGANVVYDIVGGDYSEPAIRSIAWEGRFLVVGFPAGIARLPLNLTLLKSCDVCGVFWGAFAARDPKANAAHVAELFELLKAGKINPRVSAMLPLERGGEAIALLQDRKAIGKVVVTMNG
ncbi:MAG TPA: NADPH:quinone oxidoreductase family protein [Novosphingobium sp.]|nr:NADPH:quinone oxidoreductase family protein [Novosphingobium sp.]